MPTKKSKQKKQNLTGDALVKEVCRRIRVARSYWDAHNNRACRGEREKAIALYCPPNGAIAEIWGGETYRDASSICMAAVHADQMTADGGGTVAIEIRPGRSSYSDSTEEGITSLSYGEALGSFKFVKYKPWP